MARYILCYKLKLLQRLDLKLLALEKKTPLGPEIGNLCKIMDGGTIILLQQST